MNGTPCSLTDEAPGLPFAAARWLVLTTAAYAALYGLTNHLTGLRRDLLHGVFDWERAIPFVGWTVVPYLSLCGFFALSFFVGTDDPRVLRRHVMRLFILLGVAVACYAAFPMRFTFERPAVDGIVGRLFELLRACDQPFNRAPSLHIGVLVVLWAHFVPAMKGAPRVCLQAWFGLIAVSVLTTYQHHVLDVPAGAALGFLALALTGRRDAAAFAPTAPARC
ncbi:MAG: phosphatase PAP2 family protein [Burkholderiaceae bacterium]